METPSTIKQQAEVRILPKNKDVDDQIPPQATNDVARISTDEEEDDEPTKIKIKKKKTTILEPNSETFVLGNPRNIITSPKMNIRFPSSSVYCDTRCVVHYIFDTGAGPDLSLEDFLNNDLFQAIRAVSTP